MLGEISLLIKGLDSAISLVKAGLDRKKSLDGMLGDIHSFFESKQAVEAKIIEVKKRSKNAYVGSAIQEAILIDQEAQKIKETMKRIGKAYSDAGRSPQWQAIQRNAASIQADRDRDEQAANRKKIIQDRKDEEFYFGLKLIGGIMLMLIALSGFIYALAIN